MKIYLDKKSCVNTLFVVVNISYVIRYPLFSGTMGAPWEIRGFYSLNIIRLCLLKFRTLSVIRFFREQWGLRDVWRVAGFVLCSWTVPYTCCAVFVSRFVTVSVSVPYNVHVFVPCPLRVRIRVRTRTRVRVRTVPYPYPYPYPFSVRVRCVNAAAPKTR